MGGNKMSFLRTNYEEVNSGFAALPIGEYECIISETKVVPTSTGKQMVKVTLTVRDDVEQDGQKRKFFDNLVVQDTMMWKFQQVSKAARLPEGEDIASPEAFAEAIQYKSVRIKNKHEQYNGELQDRVAWYTESKYEQAVTGGGQLDISDDDLPF